MDMQETKGPKDPAAKLPSRSPFAAPAPPPYHHHHYGTFSPPPPPQQQPVGAASSLPFPAGCAAQGVVAFPCTVQQQVLVERLPFREPPLPFCGAGVGWTFKHDLGRRRPRERMALAELSRTGLVGTTLGGHPLVRIRLMTLTSEVLFSRTLAMS
uniref:Uncharacterized protein n=1 Tax=Oryza brachyantha TaxID=4533 RepID=J3MDZ5_ORYBR